MAEVTVQPQALDEEGFLREVTGWSRELAADLAQKNDLGPLTEDHWKVIEFVHDYYIHHGAGPPVVWIARATGLSASAICRLFPCGVVRGAYRLAGLPRPFGCA